MRVFVTGASGFIGSALVSELVAAGHEVRGLARSDAAAATVRGLGAEPVPGSLDDPGRLAAAAADTDGVVHLGYHHDFSAPQEAARMDAAAIEAMGAALAGSGKLLVAITGVLGLAAGRVATERDVADPAAHPRIANAAAALALAERGVRAVVVRVPIVHGPDDPGFLTALAAIARQRGVSGYLGDGAQRWPAVHRADIAALLRRVVEDAPAGSVLHAVGEEGVSTRDIAAALGAALGVPTESVPPQHFDWLAGFLGTDMRASSGRTQELLGWVPKHQGLVADIAAGHYTGG